MGEVGGVGGGGGGDQLVKIREFSWFLDQKLCFSSDNLPS